MEEVKWFEAKQNDDGIEIIGFIEIDEESKTGKIVGYNGICVGENVKYEGEKYTVVMVSTMGDFGLSKTGKLPYSIRVSPKEVELM